MRNLFPVTLLLLVSAACGGDDSSTSGDSQDVVGTGNLRGYSLQPDEVSDATYAVTVSAGGKKVAVPVANFHDIDYGRFEGTFPVTLDIAIGRPVVKEQIQIVPL